MQSVTFSTGLARPTGVVVDGSGNIYIADHDHTRVLKEALSGGAYTESTVGSGLALPQAVAVDGNGNVYIADADNNRVLKETLSSGVYAESTVGSGLASPQGVAVDGSGSIYIADTDNNRVLKETLSGGVYAESTVGSGLTFPQAVAVDGSGNVYIADPGNNRVLKETLSGGTYAESTVGSSLSYPFGVAVDGGGNLYIADTGNNRVLMETLSGGAYTESTVGSGLNQPYSVTLDGSGNLYIADTNNNRVVEIDVRDPPTLTFPSTDVGSTSTSQTLTLANIGNAPLTFGAPGDVGSLNPSISADFTYSSSSTCSQIGSSSSNFVLAAGTSCTEIVSFAPTAAGTIAGQVVSTENNLNRAGSMQAVALNGTGTQATPTVTVSNSSTTYGTASATLSATVQFAGIAPTGSFTFTVGSGSAVPATCTAATTTTETCAASYPASALTVNNYTITGTLAADTNYNMNSSTGTLTVTQAISTLSGPAQQPVTFPYGQGGTFTISVTGQNSGTGVSQPSGTVIYTIGSSALQTAALTNGVATLTVPATQPANSYAVTASYAGDTSYSAAQPITVQLQVTKAIATVTLGSLNPTYDTNPHAATATTTPSNLNVTFTYNGSATAPTAAGSYTVVGTINDPNYSGTATVTLVISKAAATVALGSLSATYDTNQHAATATTTPSGLNVKYTYNGLAMAPTAAGSYAVLGTINDSNESGAATGTLVISKAAASVALGSLSATYDTNPHTATATTTPSNLNVTVTYNGSGTAPTAADSYTVLATITDPNYSGIATATLVIAKATAAVTLGSLSTTYDGNPHTATATTTPSGLGVTFTYNGSATVPTAAGSYTVVGTISDNNDFGTATGTLVIAKVTAPIGFAMAGHSYGDAPFTVSASSQSTGSITYAVVSGPATVSGSTVTITGGGVITLQATQAATGNYATNTQQASSTVAKALLTASVIDSTRMYGATNPAFTGTVSGAVHKDTFTESFSVPATTNSAVNTYVITPSVSGAALANYSLTATTGTLTVTQAPVTVTMTSSSTAITPGQTATLTASVASTTSGTPTGSMTFFDNGTALQTVALTNGTASYGATLSQGTTHTITGSYSGDSNFVATSATANGSTTVGVAALDFSFSGSGPATLTVVPGQVVTYTFQVAPTYGAYPGSVTFSVVGLPAGAAATFTPSGLPQNGGTTQVQMTVQLVKTMSSNTRGPLGRGTAPVTIAGLLLPLLGLRRRTRNRIELRLMLLPLLIGGALGGVAMTGCGSGVVSTDSAQSYTLVVTTTSSTVQHNQTVTLNVK